MRDLLVNPILFKRFYICENHYAAGFSLSASAWLRWSLILICPTHPSPLTPTHPPGKVPNWSTLVRLSKTKLINLMSIHRIFKVLVLVWWIFITNMNFHHNCELYYTISNAYFHNEYHLNDDFFLCIMNFCHKKKISTVIYWAWSISDKLVVLFIFS